MENELRLNGKIINLPEELINQIKEALEKNKTFPQNGDNYFYMETNGDIEDTKYDKEFAFDREQKKRKLLQNI